MARRRSSDDLRETPPTDRRAPPKVKNLPRWPSSLPIDRSQTILSTPLPTRGTTRLKTRVTAWELA